MSGYPDAARKLSPGLGSPALTSTLGKLVESLGQVLIVVLLAAALGPRDYGEFALVLTLVTALSSSLSVGGPTLAARFLPTLDPGRRLAMGRQLLVRLGRWRVLQVVGVAVPLAALVIVDPADFPPGICALAALALGLDLAATLLFQIGLGLGRVSMFSFRFGVQNAVVVGVGLGLYSLWGVRGAVAAISVSAGVVLAWAALSVGRELAGARRTGDPLSIPASVWRFGALQAAGGLLVTVVHRGGVVATALLASRTQTGYAALAIGVGVAGTYVVSQAFAVNLPHLVERLDFGRDEIEREVLTFAGRALAIVTALSLLAAIAVPRSVAVFFGPGFAGARDALYVGLALLPLAPVMALLAQLAALRLAHRQLVVPRAAGVVVFVVVVAVAVPRWGALGASAAVLAATLATLVGSALEIAVPRRGLGLILAAIGASSVVLLIAVLG